MLTKTLTQLIVLLFFIGCASLSVDEVNQKKSEIDKMAAETIKALIKSEPLIQQQIKEAKGYAVIDWTVTKIPVFGAGGGRGVIVDLRTNERIYIDVSRFDIGGGWGARSFKNLIITEDETLLDNAKDGSFKFEAGAEVAAGKHASDVAAEDTNSYSHTYVLSEGGGAATATIRMLYSNVNEELNTPIK